MWLSRTELVLGKEAIEKLKTSRVAVFGVGGVGGYVVEALVRSGIGQIDLIDNDKVSLTNINRQLVATTKTVGLYKVDVAAQRCLDINPSCIVNTYKMFYLPETDFDFTVYDYVVDAIDTVSAKLALIENAKKAGVPIICSMGAGNKLNPTMFEVSDISKTSVDPLARIIRQECRKRGLKNFKVVWSKENPKSVGGRVPGSVSFVPSVVGLIVASEVVKDLVGVGLGQ